MPSVSGLSRDQRIRARDRAVQAAMLGLSNTGAVHYVTPGTPQSAKRWDGIKNRRDARLGQFPKNSDCSSFATWCLWNGLHLAFGLGDLVNGAGWMAGFTGTMINHGKRVRHLANVRRGDCVLYGSGPSPSHVTIVVGRQQGVPMVVSHGSEPGPFFVRYDYRSDVMQIRRYI
jgi:hypothetical protein